MPGSMTPKGGTTREFGSRSATPAPAPTGTAAPAPTPAPAGHPVAGIRRGSQAARAEMLFMDPKALRTLDEQLCLLDVYVNQRYMTQLADFGTVNALSSGIGRGNLRLIELTQLVCNESESFYEKLVSIYSAMNSKGGTLGLLIRSDGKLARIYLCTSADQNGQDLLEANLRGHFPGSIYARQDNANSVRVLDDCFSPRPSRVIRSVSMIPGRREDEQKNTGLRFSAQGFEKFIDAMAGRAYSVLILAESLESQAIDACKSGYEGLYTLLSPFAKENVSFAENGSETQNFSLADNFSKSVADGITSTFGTSRSHTTGTNQSRSRGNSMVLFGAGFNSSTGSGTSTADASGTQSSSGSSLVTTIVNGGGTTSGTTNTSGWTRTVSLNRDVRSVQGCMEQIQQNIERIDQNRSFGMWNCACYVVADDAGTAIVASSTLVSLIAGDTNRGAHVYMNQWDMGTLNPAQRDNARNVLDSLAHLQNPAVDIRPQLNGAPIGGVQTVIPGLMVSGRDLPSIMRLPQRSVSGLVVDTMAEFGRNFSVEWLRGVRRPIRFGNIIHMGAKENTEVIFDMDAFASHCFICGAAGSGKSNTTYNLLQKFIDADVPFLVIEPVKGEYKAEFGGLNGVRVFTARQDEFRMLRINPFEFNRSLHIREHLGRLLSVVSACWPLYGPMPAMLKEAFEEAYASCGWDLELSEQIVENGKRFPTFADVLPEVERLIRESSYSADGKGDFTGALVTRIRMLLNGFEGEIFANDLGIPEEELFNGRTIVDLSNISSPESRALIMGMLIIKLREYRAVEQERYRRSTGAASAGKLRHVTILEEAHNILKRCSHEVSQDSGNIQGASVGMLVDCIAELRSSGEGFLIVDQSPSAVDEAAIKNTAIKIVMRLPEKEDSEAMANALALREDQMRELSRLKVGVAAVYHVGWQETVLAKMGEVWKSPAPVASRPALRQDLVSVRSAIVQWIFEKMEDEEYAELTKAGARRYVKDLQASACKSLSANDVADLEQQLDGFFAQCRSVLASGERNSPAQVRELAGKFFRRVLQIDGLFRIVRLGLPVKGVRDELSGSEQAQVIRWYQKLVSHMGSYLYMPESAGGTRWKPGDPEHSEYFPEVLGLVMKSWESDYHRSHPKDWSYYKAMAHLNRSKRIRVKLPAGL